MEWTSPNQFSGLIWGCFGLCLILFIGRIWMRWVSFHKLILEDYLMLFVLCTRLASAIVAQTGIGYIFMMSEVARDQQRRPPTLTEDVAKGLRAYVTVKVLLITGVWGIRINFLVFFYRIFCTVDRLLKRIWWGIFSVTVACLGITYGLVAASQSFQWKSSYASITPGMTLDPTELKSQDRRTRAISSLDVLNDGLIILFPLAILWSVGLSVKKKIYISLMFGLLSLTAAISLIRAITSNYVHRAGDEQIQTMLWLWFWWEIELDVSFLVACLVNFRSIFTQRRMKKRNQSPNPAAGLLNHNDNGSQPRTFGSRDKVRKPRSLYASIVETCIDLEGETLAVRQLGDSGDNRGVHVHVQAESREERVRGKLISMTEVADR